ALAAYLFPYTTLFRSEVDHAAQVAELLVVAADQSADHGVGLAALDHQRRDQRGPRADQALGRGLGDAAALGQRVVLLPVVVEARSEEHTSELQSRDNL